MCKDNKNRYISEKLGLCWHEPAGNIYHEFQCSCGKEWGNKKQLFDHIVEENPNFFKGEGIIELLKLMEARDDGKIFFANLIYLGENIEAIDDDGLISREYITENGKLLNAVYEWFMEKYPD